MTHFCSHSIKKKTSREPQNAALRTSHRLPNVSNFPLKKRRKLILKIGLFKLVTVVTVVTAVTIVTVMRKITKTLNQKNHSTSQQISNLFLSLFQHFLKEQFNTFDNRCDVLRAASPMLRDCVILCVERVCGFFCEECLHDFSHTLRLHDLFLWRLRNIFAERLRDFFGRGCVFFFWRGCTIFLCGEVA